jgi:hypothetical protein
MSNAMNIALKIRKQADGINSFDPFETVKMPTILPTSIGITANDQIHLSETVLTGTAVSFAFVGIVASCVVGTVVLRIGEPQDWQNFACSSTFAPHLLQYITITSFMLKAVSNNKITHFHIK